MTQFLIFGRPADPGPLKPFMADTGEVINGAGATRYAPLVVAAWTARDAIECVWVMYPNGLPEYMETLTARAIFAVNGYAR